MHVINKLPLLGFAYPLLAHAAVALDSPGLLLAAVVLLALLVLAPALARGSRLAFVALPFAAAGIAWLHARHATVLPLYAPPVLVNVALAWLFGHTLRSGSVPLIERLVRLLHPADEVLDAAIPPYARRLTLAWTVLFAVLAIVNLALALVATPGGVLESAGIASPVGVSREVWSLFANVLNYAIVVAFFVLEYAYRRRKFPQQPYRGIVDFVLRAAAVGPRLFASAPRATAAPAMPTPGREAVER